MKIAGKNPFVNLEAYIESMKEQKKLSGSVEKVSGCAGGGDRVELSARGKEIQEARKLVDAVPDMRNEKIALIRKQIENGTYHINSEKTAASMLKEVFLNQLF